MELLGLYYVVVFYLGTILGSFLNVVTLDLQKLFKENNLAERKELPFFAKHWTKRYFWQSVLSRRSHCDNCNSDLGVSELFPIFSYVFQRGKCKKCGTHIDAGHLYVELICGVMFTGIFYTIFWQYEYFSGAFLLSLSYWFLVFGLLFIIALFDYRTQLIPDVLVLAVSALLVGGTAYSVSEGWAVPDWQVYGAGVLFAVLFYAAWFFSRGKWIGFADGKLAFLVGVLFGISQGFTALAIAFWSGALVSVGIILVQKIRHTKSGGLSLQSTVAFGPFMIFAMWYVFVFGLNLFSVTW